ncbi:MAG: pseudouridine-5'-phosphate glycosidase [Gemmatimonadetes bacterium]|nr:pseudouridine-5'-phosphate glycosidase [Gemmatimonadota bacterium]
MSALGSLRISPQVREALERDGPVVALESTVIAHGLPRPRNLEVAERLEAIVRDEGALAATIGVIGGVPTIGLSSDEMTRLGTSESVLKASTRDLGHAVATSRDAATTVAATAELAHRAGIRVFATGGIGGVHRDGERSLDISADLTALSTTPVAVVCAGAKAILDLGRTLEMLETLGVPVVGVGTAEFPAFYTRSSGHALDISVADAREAATVIRAHRALGLEAGVLVCNPPPAETELSAARVAAWIEAADEESVAAGVTGKDVTPWLLERLARSSGGRTVETNVALLESNARLAARIAVALAPT